MKSALFLVAVFVSFGIDTANAGTTRVESIQVGRILGPNETINVRKSMDGLRRNDFVIKIDVVAAATNVVSSDMTLVADDVNQGMSGRFTQYREKISFILNKRNGVDYRTLHLKLSAPAFIDSIEVVIADNRAPRDEDLVPVQNEGVFDLELHKEAYDFAYRSDGLDLLTDEALAFADRLARRPYGRQYLRNFKELFYYVISGEGPALGRKEGREWAIERIRMEGWRATLPLYKVAFRFAYTSDGFDWTTDQAMEWADAVSARPDGGAYFERFLQLFSYARSQLSMDRADAQAWVEKRIGSVRNGSPRGQRNRRAPTGIPGFFGPGPGKINP